MTEHEGEEYLSLEEASAILGTSRRTVERYIKHGRLNRYRRGLRVLVKRSEVVALSAERDEIIQEDEE